MWAEISAVEKIDLVVLEGNLNSKKYIDVIENHLMPHAQGSFGLDF